MKCLRDSLKKAHFRSWFALHLSGCWALIDSICEVISGLDFNDLLGVRHANPLSRLQTQRGEFLSPHAAGIQGIDPRCAIGAQ